MSNSNYFLSRINAARELYPSALLVFRIGDFFELWGDDAKTAAALLGLTLTTRDKTGNAPIAMAGFPYHQIAAYTAKLIHEGKRLVIFDDNGATLQPGGFTVTGCEVLNPSGFRVCVMTSPRKAAAAAWELAKHSTAEDTASNDSEERDNDAETLISEPVRVESPGFSDDEEKRVPPVQLSLGLIAAVSPDELAEVQAKHQERAETLISEPTGAQSPGFSAESADDHNNDDHNNDHDTETAEESAAVGFLKWTSTAGPRQTKTAAKAISSFQSHARFRREITDSGTMLICSYGSNPCRAGVTLHNAIFATYGGTITAKNYKTLADEIAAAQSMLELPTDDRRTTDEEKRAERERRAALDVQRKAEQETKATETDKQIDELRALYPWAAGRDGFKTGSARAAANLRQELKNAFPGVKFKVTSESFSMGDAVNVKWSAGPCSADVRSIADKYIDGHFDGMQDMYENDNSAYGRAVEIVLGRAKYVSCDRSDSCEIKLRIAPMVCELYGKPCNHGLDSPIYENESYMSGELRRVLSDIVDGHTFPVGITLEDITGVERIEREEHDYSAPKFRIVYPLPTSPTTAAATPASSSGATTTAAAGSQFTIEKHFHEKRAREFWLVVPVGRLERAAYDDALTAARNAGGWQSRKWGRTPSGFGFETETAAAAYVNQQAGGTTTDNGETAADSLISEPARVQSPGFSGSAANVNQQTAEKLRALADGMTRTIADKLAPMSQNWTHKRGREHGSRVIEGERLERVRVSLVALADAWEAGTVPPILRSLKTKTAVYELCGNIMKTSNSGEYYDSREPKDHSPAAVALRSLIESKTTDDHREAQEAGKRAQEITRAENALRTANCPGFFPSPPAVCTHLVYVADIPGDIPPDFCILEPSAGIGSIVDALIQKTNVSADQIQLIESRQSMAEVCQLKGYEISLADFLECSPEQYGLFDRVVMNPPFEKRADALHVKHAFRFLKPGGTLAAVVSSGLMSGTDLNATRFRDWLESVDGTAEEMPAGSFTGAESFRQTGVNVYRVTIRAAESADVADESPAIAPHAQTLISEPVRVKSPPIEEPAADVYADFSELAFL